MAVTGGPLIGVTTYTPAGDEKGNYYLPAQYVEALEACGASALLMGSGDARLMAERVDGLVLAGGGDMDPVGYGGRPHPANYMVDGGRDRFELTLAGACIEEGIPLLAICRGLQILNVALGGDLVAHLPDRYGESVIHRLPPREPVAHEVEVRAGTLLAGVVGVGALEVMSWHHQGVGRVAPALEVTALAADGVIEALEKKGAPCGGWMLAVQWHPELNFREVPRHASLFEALVTEARFYRGGKRR